ncbi:MAG: phosphopantetheine-binding protein [Vicinamibacterales bacterium]
MSAEPLTLERMREDIAEVLDESVDAIVAGENLVDLGIDSIRIMSLAQRWSRPGARIEFDDLAAYPELQHWWDAVAQRHATAERVE